MRKTEVREDIKEERQGEGEGATNGGEVPSPAWGGGGRGARRLHCVRPEREPGGISEGRGGGILRGWIGAPVVLLLPLDAGRRDKSLGKETTCVASAHLMQSSYCKFLSLL